MIVFLGHMPSTKLLLAFLSVPPMSRRWCSTCNSFMPPHFAWCSFCTRPNMHTPFVVPPRPPRLGALSMNRPGKTQKSAIRRWNSSAAPVGAKAATTVSPSPSAAQSSATTAGVESSAISLQELAERIATCQACLNSVKDRTDGHAVDIASSTTEGLERLRSLQLAQKPPPAIR